VIAVAVMIYKTLHRKPKMEQYELLKNGDELVNQLLVVTYDAII
jgi:hypothetical protein